MKQILYILLLFTFSLNAQQPAFPTAYGGGAYATGGRGGNVYHVTNLLDDGSVGSLRWAIAQPRPATIVFDVSGTMELTTVLTVGGADLTVAGQTAPQGGFEIVQPPAGNHQFRIGTFGTSFENQIWRYIKIRGQYDPNDNVLLGLMPGYTQETDYGRNLIFDHISFNYGADEGFGIRGNNTDNITMQHCLFSENVRGALFGDTDGNNVGLTEPRSQNNTFRNNVFYHSSHRVPNVGSNPADVYNNVVYDWKERLSVIVWGTKINHFNNYYYKGTRTNIAFSWNGDPVNTRWYVNGITTQQDMPVEIYSKGNVIQDFYEYDGNNPDIANPFSDDRYIWMHHAGELVDGTPIIPDDQQKNKADSSYFRNTPLPYIGRIPQTFLTAQESSTVVVNDSGAYKYIKNDGTIEIYRDVTDQRIVDAIINDIPTAWTISDGDHSAQSSQNFFNYQTTISTTPVNVRLNDFYVSNPHIPESYLTVRGITGDATIHNEIQPSGYTLLEEYINQVDDVAPEVPDKGDTSRILKILISN